MIPTFAPVDQTAIGLALTSWTTRKLDYMKQLFLDNEQQVVQDCDPKEEGNKQVSPTTALAFCMEVCSRQQHREREPKQTRADLLCWGNRVSGDCDGWNFGTNNQKGGNNMEKNLPISE